jgi:hypothetical protein
MTTQIWKYPLNGMMSDIQMPMEAKVLTVQIQNGQPTIWAQVNPQNESETRHFTIVGTGNPFDDTNHKYIGTFQDSPFVWHLFEIVK